MEYNAKKPVKIFRFLDWVIIIILLLTAVICFDMFRHDLSFTFNLQNRESIGTVVVRKNTVQRRLGDRVLWDRLSRESPVYVWDLIRVAETSAATLQLNGASIELEENTLVRIVPSADGEGITIVMNYGSLSFFVEDRFSNITLEVNGQLYNPQPSLVLNITATEGGQATFQILDNIRREVLGPQLLSPAVNSLYRYENRLPDLRFQWVEVEDAVSYIIEISSSPDFTNLYYQVNNSSVFFSTSSLGEGVWFWRVTPVLSPMFDINAVNSSVSFFRILEATSTIDPLMSLSQWLLSEAPPMELPPDIPLEFIPVSFIQQEELIHSESIHSESILPEPAVEPPPPPPPPPPLLAAPRTLNPARGTMIDHDELISQNAIVFRWSAVQGANAYIFTLSQQTPTGRRRIIQTTINSLSYTLNNMRLLDRGNFVWQVEAVNRGRNNVVNRRGRVVESTISIDFQNPNPVFIEEPGILYGGYSEQITVGPVHIEDIGILYGN
jgi:hypothetical protein